jgi:autophagy-related protein 2
MLSLPRLPFELPGFSLPIAVPGRIQQRFVSFLLQRFLGHLVKPGQLDASQIDAQIGGGTVEIKRIELDEQVCPLIPFVSEIGFIHAQNRQ